MSDERETPASRGEKAPETAHLGAPVEESAASEDDVLEAVERAKNPSTVEPDASAAGELDGPNAAAAASDSDASSSAGPLSSSGVTDSGSADPEVDGAEAAHRRAVSEVDTQLDIDTKSDTGKREPTITLDELPSAADEPVPVRDGEIRVSADHPMAALYTQTPAPPELKGNRGAGVLIAVLATLVFAVVYAAAIALSLAPSLAPSQFVDGLLEELLTIRSIVATVAFLVGLVVLVLIVGKAGWWAYVLGGFLVGAFVWVATTAGAAVDTGGVRELFTRAPLDLIADYGLTIPVIAAALVAREVTVWFGAWIGRRGRRIKQRNAEALADYEVALQEVQAKQP